MITAGTEGWRLAALKVRVGALVQRTVEEKAVMDVTTPAVKVVEMPVGRYLVVPAAKLQRAPVSVPEEIWMVV
jgi:hypothetical protein